VISIVLTPTPVLGFSLPVGPGGAETEQPHRYPNTAHIKQLSPQAEVARTMGVAGEGQPISLHSWAQRSLHVTQMWNVTRFLDSLPGNGKDKVLKAK
jgi:hypothetical protein